MCGSDLLNISILQIRKLEGQCNFNNLAELAFETPSPHKLIGRKELATVEKILIWGVGGGR